MINFDKHKTLDTINEWIHNCDSKTSIILTAIGVLISALVSSDVATGIIHIIKINIYEKTVCSILYLSIFLLSIIFMLCGIFMLFSVLVPKIDLQHKSIMFFGNIASNAKFENYCDEVTKCTETDLSEDLLHQIYAASKICNKKFNNYKKGISIFGLGTLLLFAWLIIGFIVFYL